MTAREFLPMDDVLARALGDLSGLTVVDIGCGAGRVTRALAALGAHAVGVEPNADQVARAEAVGGGPRYRTGSADATGLPDGDADLALFSLSLHHTPDMAAGLAEARRITRPGGRIAVMEPEAPDPIWPVMRFIDDESVVYAEAQAAIAAAIQTGAIARRTTLRFADKYRARDAAAMIADLITIDGERRLDPADRPAFEAAFAAAHQTDAEGGYIPYWCRFDVFDRL